MLILFVQTIVNLHRPIRVKVERASGVRVPRLMELNSNAQRSPMVEPKGEANKKAWEPVRYKDPNVSPASNRRIREKVLKLLDAKGLYPDTRRDSPLAYKRL